MYTFLTTKDYKNSLFEDDQMYGWLCSTQNQNSYIYEIFIMCQKPCILFYLISTVMLLNKDSYEPHFTD